MSGEVLSIDDNVERIMSALAIVATQRDIFFDIRQRYWRDDQLIISSQIHEYKL